MTCKPKIPAVVEVDSKSSAASTNVASKIPNEREVEKHLEGAKYSPREPDVISEDPDVSQAVSIGKKLLIISNTAFGPSRKDRKDLTFIPDSVEDVDTFRILSGKYWSTTDDEKAMTYLNLNTSNGIKHDIIDYNFTGRGVIQLSELLEEEEAQDRAKRMATKQWILVRANKNSFQKESNKGAIPPAQAPPVTTAGGVNIASPSGRFARFNPSDKRPAQTFEFSEEMWETYVNGGATDQNELFLPLIQQGLEFEDHTFEMDIPFDEDTIEEFSGVNKPLIIDIDPYYNFSIMRYERNIIRVDENILPNLYIFASEVYEETNNEDFKNLLTLGSSLDIKDIPRIINFSQNVIAQLSIPLNSTLKSVRQGSFKLTGEYYNKYANSLNKIYSENNQEIRSNLKERLKLQLALLSKRMNNIIIPTTNFDILNRYNSKKYLFPMYFDINFSTTKAVKFSNILNDTKLTTKFMNEAVNGDFAKLNSYIEAQTTISQEKVKLKTSLNLSKNKRRQWNVTDILDREQVVDLSDKVHVGSITEEYLMVEGSEQKFLKYLTKTLFKARMESTVKQKFRTFKELMEGKLAYSETIFYAIKKYKSTTAQTKAGSAMQTVYIPNIDDTISYIDTQVKYDRLYIYEIFAYQLVIGNKYTYENLMLNKENVTFSVTQEPSLALIEVPYFQIIGSVLDDLPTRPNVDIIPYKGVDNEISFFLNGTTGEIEEEFKVVEPDDEMFIEKYVMSRNIKGNKIKFRTDDPPTTFEIYKIDFMPTSYNDFAGNKIAVVQTDITAQTQQSATSATFKDRILPNKKYYYIFRTIDIHDHISNPTEVFEIELVNNSGIVYPIINVLSEFKDQNDFISDKSCKKYIQIKPSAIQSLINEEKSGILDVESVRDIKNIHLGLADENIWDKKFKVRLKSKHSGKKIDINLTFQNKFIKLEDQ